MPMDGAKIQTYHAHSSKAASSPTDTDAPGGKTWPCRVLTRSGMPETA
jgi:hypothetical protein